VYTPRFDANRYTDGSRISFYNPSTGTVTGRNDTLDTRVPDDWFGDDEVAARLYTNWHGYELAVYGYTGFWKGPRGSDPVSGKAIFPELDVLGLSGRGTLGPGIANIEFGYYHSGDDSSGTDPAVVNSEVRFMAGYEQEIARETTLGLQYYLERMQDYSRYRDNLPAGSPARDHNRHVLTIRFTRLALQQDLILSVFNFYSPSDEDGYLRAGVSYRLDDNWVLSGGLNHFYGDERHTFFGQLEKNSNVYTAIHYGFGSW
jgi:hypothetical protein